MINTSKIDYKHKLYVTVIVMRNIGVPVKVNILVTLPESEIRAGTAEFYRIRICEKKKRESIYCLD